MFGKITKSLKIISMLGFIVAGTLLESGPCYAQQQVYSCWDGMGANARCWGWGFADSRSDFCESIGHESDGYGYLGDVDECEAMWRSSSHKNSSSLKK